MTHPWAITSDQTLRQLQSNTHHGLSREVVTLRQRRYGRNNLKTPRPASILQVFVAQFRSPLMYLLAITAGLMLWQSQLVDAGVIVIVLVVNSFIGTYQEYRAQVVIGRLRHILAPQARVIRESREQRIPAELLVPGDIIVIEAGNRVPADARLITAQNLRVNQASLTGEAIPVHKHDSLTSPGTTLADRANMLHLSTMVVAGQGTAVVTAIGMNTEIGQIAKEVSAVTPHAGPLERQLQTLGNYLAVLALVAVIVTALVGLWRGLPLPLVVNTALSLLVSVVPEGLPLAIVVTLSLGLMRLYRHRVLLRQLAAAETLGSTTVIGVDKTGTVTYGQLMVERLVTLQEEVTVTGRGYQLSGNFLVGDQSVKVQSLASVQLMLELASMATMSTITKEDLTSDRARELTDPTETALAVVAAKAGYYAFREEVDYPELLEIPFDQELRYSTSIHRYKQTQRAIVKGAPEKILELADSVITKSGQPRRLLAATKQALEHQIHHYSGLGYRVSAMAYVDYPLNHSIDAPSINHLVFVGLFCMTDPVRPESRQAILAAKKAGVRVMMLTGDHVLTAAAVAKAAGFGSDVRVVHANDLKGRSLDEIDVIARATPSDKLSIVSRLQQAGEVVAMTGDGVNDAPALKKADLGIAMGHNGTDVAIEASDMVLLHDNFLAVVTAIAQGRLIWQNLQKIVFFLMVTSLAVLLVVLGALIGNLPLPLLPTQIVWMNLVVGGLVSLALAFEGPDKNLMANPPRALHRPILDSWLYLRLIVISFVIALLTLSFFVMLQPFGLEYARSVTLFSLVIFQLYALLASRSAKESILNRHFWRNRTLFYSLVIALLVQLLVSQIKFFHPLLHLVPIPGWVVTTAILLGITIVVADELMKLAYRSVISWARRESRLAPESIL